MNKVSVVIATYNGERFIKEQLMSILTQSMKPDEIIISDNKSSDCTIAICEDILKESNILYRVIYEEQKGVIANFQNACKHCTGDIVFFCDQDDIWYESKIEQFMNIFQSIPECSMIFGDADLNYKDSSRTLINELCKNNKVDLRCGMQKKEYFIELELYKNVVTGMSMACRKEIIDISIPFSSYVLHDYWIALNSTFYGRVYYFDKSTAYYRQHENNVIGINKKITIKSIKESLHKNFVEISNMHLFLQQLNARFDNIQKSKFFINKIDFIEKRKNILSTKNKLIGLYHLCKLRKKYAIYTSDPNAFYKDAINILMFNRGQYEKCVH